MYCRNCGAQISDFAQICVKCGVPAGSGEQYCSNCGMELQDGTRYCPRCGYGVKQGVGPYPSQQQKSKIAAGLLGIFLGWLGVHNFYLGYKKKALAQLLISVLSFGTLSWISELWGFIEGILIFSGSIHSDAQGIPLRE